MNQNEQADLASRMSRIESKLSQLMLHMGLDPAVRKYDTPRLAPYPDVWRLRSKEMLQQPTNK